MGSTIEKMLKRPVIIIKDYFQWKKSEAEFAKFVNKWKSNWEKTDHELKGSIAVVIHPWSITAVPWFFIAIALFFTQANKKVTIILDDFEFGRDKFFFDIQIRSIKRILSLLPQSINVIYLSSLKRNGKSNPPDNKIIDELATLNTIHFMKGELLEKGRKEYFNLIHQQLENVSGSICQMFDENSFDLIVVGGGIWGSSGLYLKLAKKHNIRAATLDGSLGSVLLSINGVASYQSDIPLAFHQLDEINLDKILRAAQTEMEKRKLGIDNVGTQSPTHQKIPYSKTEYKNDVGILLLLNVIWDSAALGLHTVFKTTGDWVLESIQWVLENTDEVITIRQHPSERTVEAKSNDDYHVLIDQHFGHNERIRFISAIDDVNTYNLIEKSRFVISFSTTASMEAVSMGKIVINISRCYYSDLGFVYNSKTKEEYFTHLKNAVNGTIGVSPKQKEDALKCYYLGQCCNLVHTIFTPIPDDFKKWVNEDPEVIYDLDDVKNYLYAIENGIPISLIRHQDKMRKMVLSSDCLEPTLP